MIIKQVTTSTQDCLELLEILSDTVTVERMGSIFLSGTQITKRRRMLVYPFRLSKNNCFYREPIPFFLEFILLLNVLILRPNWQQLLQSVMCFVWLKAKKKEVAVLCVSDCVKLAYHITISITGSWIRNLP